LHDLLVSQGHFAPPHGLQELHLDVSTEAFLGAERAFTYADLYAMLENGNTVGWLTPRAAVVRPSGRGVHLWEDILDASFRYCFTVDAGKEINAMAGSHEDLSEICNVVLRLLAASPVHSVILRKRGSRDGASINAPTLAYLMEQCHSLKVLTIQDQKMGENHCRVLGAYSRPDLEIELKYCKLTRAGTRALAEVLGRN
jgi:hypothetical protein